MQDEAVQPKEFIIMNRSMAFVSCAALSLFIASGLAAEAATPSDNPMLEVQVQAQRVVRHVVGRDSAGIPTELIQLTRRVGYSDLNLTKYADVTKLKTRIDTTAKQACKALADMYPLVAPNNPDCVKEAVDGAMKQAQVAIKTANNKTSNSKAQG
jgi:UrcA family protein